jgi:putative cell wall-binding protein
MLSRKIKTALVTLLSASLLVSGGVMAASAAPNMAINNAAYNNNNLFLTGNANGNNVGGHTYYVKTIQGGGQTSGANTDGLTPQTAFATIDQAVQAVTNDIIAQDYEQAGYGQGTLLSDGTVESATNLPTTANPVMLAYNKNNHPMFIGDAIEIYQGTYAEQINFYNLNSASKWGIPKDAMITVMPAPNQGAVVIDPSQNENASNPTLPANQASTPYYGGYCVDIRNSSNIIINGLTLQNANPDAEFGVGVNIVGYPTQTGPAICPTGANYLGNLGVVGTPDNYGRNVVAADPSTGVTNDGRVFGICTRITVENCTICNNMDFAVYARYADYVNISNNNVFNNAYISNYAKLNGGRTTDAAAYLMDSGIAKNAIELDDMICTNYTNDTTVHNIVQNNAIYNTSNNCFDATAVAAANLTGVTADTTSLTYGGVGVQVMDSGYFNYAADIQTPFLDFQTLSTAGTYSQILNNYAAIAAATTAGTTAPAAVIMPQSAALSPVTVIENNLIYYNGGPGVSVVDAYNTQVVNNTLYLNGLDNTVNSHAQLFLQGNEMGAQAALDGQSKATDPKTVINNNIFYGINNTSTAVDPTTNAAVSYPAINCSGYTVAPATVEHNDYWNCAEVPVKTSNSPAVVTSFATLTGQVVFGSTAVANYADTKPLYKDPMFVAAPTSDFSFFPLAAAPGQNDQATGALLGTQTYGPSYPSLLQATSKDFNPNGSTDLSLQASSPCIDAGTTDNAPATDIIGTARPQGAAIDIGAYECIPASGAGTTRISGVDRYDTAVQVAKAGWTSSSVVFLATGATYPDALSAVSLATQCNSGNGAPILLTTKDTTPAVTLAEIKALGATTIVVLGQESAISQAQVTLLQSETGAVAYRIGGQDRYETAADIAWTLTNFNGSTQASMWNNIGTNLGVDGVRNVAVLTSGANYPDALSMGAVCGEMNWPLLLTQQNVLPQFTKNYLQQMYNYDVSNGLTSTVYVVGGNSAISQTVINAIKAMGITVDQTLTTGATRYDTSALIATTFQASPFNLFGNTVAVATGANFPDALTGGVYAAVKDMPMLLIDPVNGASTAEQAYTAAQIVSLPGVTIFGGTTALPDSAANTIVAAPSSGS